MIDYKELSMSLQMHKLSENLTQVLRCRILSVLQPTLHNEENSKLGWRVVEVTICPLLSLVALAVYSLQNRANEIKLQLLEQSFPSHLFPATLINIIHGKKEGKWASSHGYVIKILEGFIKQPL